MPEIESGPRRAVVIDGRFALTRPLQKTATLLIGVRRGHLQLEPALVPAAVRRPEVLPRLHALQPLARGVGHADRLLVDGTATDHERLHVFPEQRVDLCLRRGDPLRDQLRQRVVDASHGYTPIRDFGR